MLLDAGIIIASLAISKPINLVKSRSTTNISTYILHITIVLNASHISSESSFITSAFVRLSHIKMCNLIAVFFRERRTHSCASFCYHDSNIVSLIQNLSKWLLAVITKWHAFYSDDYFNSKIILKYIFNGSSCERF